MGLVAVAFVMIGFVLVGLPIALALGLTGMLAVFLSGLPLQSVPFLLFNSSNSYALVAIPLFMLMGAIVDRSGIGRHLMDFASALVGWMRGGLAHVNTVQSLLFAGMNGSAAADVASTGPIIIPEMARKGYPVSFAAAVTSSTAELAMLIPPSIVLIVYGVLANVSITRMFLAGIVPGLILAAAYMILSHFMAIRQNWPIHEPFEPRRLAKISLKAGPGLLIPIVIMGGILGGIFTATESAAIAVAVAVFLVVFLYRNVSFSDAYEILIVTTKRTGMVMLVIAASGILAWYLSNQQIPQQLAARILDITSNYVVIMLMVNVFLIILGTMISGVPAMIIVVPVVLPIMLSIGVDPVHFGIIFALAIAVGSQTPPVAATMLLTCSIAGISIREMWTMNKWFILANIIVMLIATFVPSLSLWLPSLILD